VRRKLEKKISNSQLIAKKTLAFCVFERQNLNILQKMRAFRLACLSDEKRD